MRDVSKQLNQIIEDAYKPKYPGDIESLKAVDANVDDFLGELTEEEALYTLASLREQKANELKDLEEKQQKLKFKADRIEGRLKKIDGYLHQRLRKQKLKKIEVEDLIITDQSDKRCVITGYDEDIIDHYPEYAVETMVLDEKAIEDDLKDGWVIEGAELEFCPKARVFRRNPEKTQEESTVTFIDDPDTTKRLTIEKLKNDYDPEQLELQKHKEEREDYESRVYAFRRDNLGW